MYLASGRRHQRPGLIRIAFDRWFAELLRLMCPAAPVVVAHSLLGSFAVRFAVRHRALLQRLVVYAAPGVGPYRMPMGLRVVAVRFAVRPTARNAERFERFALLDLDATRRRDPEWYDAFSAYTTARAKDRHAKATMRQLIRAGTKQVPDAELRTIDVPTALLWGRDDRMAPLQLAEGASTRLRWPLYVVDGAAHVPHIEQPGSFRLGAVRRHPKAKHQEHVMNTDTITPPHAAASTLEAVRGAGADHQGPRRTRSKTGDGCRPTWSTS